MIAATTFGLTSCSDSNGGDSPSGGDGEGITAYLRVNLNPVGTAAGVASSKSFLRDATHNYPDGTEYDGTNGKADKEYKDGTEDEGKINNVRFYFFNSNGSAYTINKNTTNGVDQDERVNNYLDITSWSTPTLTPNDPTTIERQTQGVLVINGTTAAMPAKILALVNLDDDGKAIFGSAALSESEVLDKAKTIQQYTMDGVSSKENFIMSSTAYLSGGAKVVSSTITSANYAATAEAARQAVPVQLYVERLAARVDVNAGTSSNWDKVEADESTELAGKSIYTLPDGSGKTLDYVDGNSTKTKNQIYVVVKGWGLADENNNAPIIKSLDESYTDLADDALENNINTSTNQPLSVSDYHRSFWETANGYSRITYTFNQYLNGNATDDERVNDACGKALGGTAYTFPNTPTSNTAGWKFTWNETNRRETAETTQTPTKVVIAAELMYKDENDKLQPAVIGTYHGQKYLGEDNVKAAIAADMLASADAKLCVKDEDNSTATKTVYTKINADNIKFEVVGDPGTATSYMLKPVIATNDDGTLKETYYTYQGGVYTKLNNDANNNATDINTKLQSVAGSNITIYNGGNTYYYTTLQHLWFPTLSTGTLDYNTKPTNAGAWGVVRNHLYKVTLNSIVGWGTPVYDPTKIIIPVTPKDQQSYLGAQINVLMWRVVNQSVDINGEPLTN